MALLFTTVDLRERGWTAAMIKAFMPTPDDTATNPHYRTGPEMRLYDPGRVESIEETDAWKERAEKARVRSIRMAEVAENRVNGLIERACETKVSAIFDLEDLERRATASWLKRKGEEDVFMIPSDTERLMVNFLRHKCSQYEAWLSEFEGKPGAEDARWIIREKVYGQIGRAYPTLRAECRRQLRRRRQQFP